MTPLQAELLAISAAVRAAMVALGLLMRGEARTRLRSVRLDDDRSRVVARDDLVRMALQYRAKAGTVGLAAYSLRRALVTGTGIQVPGGPTHASLDQLRENFARSIGGVADDYEVAEHNATPATDLDPLDRLVDLADDLAASEEAEGDRLAGLLDSVFTKAATDDARLRALDLDAEADLATAARSGHVEALVDKTVLSGTRRATVDAQGRDPASAGYLRVPALGCCDWCAAIAGFGRRYADISAAELSLRSKKRDKQQRAAKAKGLDDDGGYHTNCACQAEPIWSADEMKTDPRFAFVREQVERWEKVRAEHGGAYDLAAFKAAYAASQTTA